MKRPSNTVKEMWHNARELPMKEQLALSVVVLFGSGLFALLIFLMVKAAMKNPWDLVPTLGFLVLMWACYTLMTSDKC